MTAQRKSAVTGGASGAIETERTTILTDREEFRADVEAAVYGSTHPTRPGAGALAGRMAQGVEQGRRPRSGEAGTSRDCNGERDRSATPTVEDEAAAAVATVSPTMAPALVPSSEACPLCGLPYLRRNQDTIGEPWAVACDECCRQWPTVDALMAEVAERDTLAWRSLPDFLREILREPATEQALRRVIRPLLIAGIEAEIVLEIAHALNARRARPAPQAHVEDLAVAIAQEIATARRKGAA